MKLEMSEVSAESNMNVWEKNYAWQKLTSLLSKSALELTYYGCLMGSFQS